MVPRFFICLVFLNLALLGLIPGLLAAQSNEFQLWRVPSTPSTRFIFEGWVRDRLQANFDNWLIPAPAANPGMLAMFELRDRQPAPNLVPWAGEFVGKYLISAVQAMRMQPGERVAPFATTVVDRLIAAQADDGYLGPFRKHERLLGHWDLWGHYHCMLGLLMWHEETASTNALHAARKIADLVCNSYLDTGKRAFDAGSDEMNLAIIHSLGWLYRITQEPRYLRMIREIEKDWERGGDYLRAGLDRTEFFQSKRPRWESLHNIQGLVELYRITGEQKYRDAFEHLWRSIARWDLRNTGGFSSGEQATGNPYAPTPIETCCTIAWMALSVDMLSLNADPKVADLLELATFNAWAGAQHPSGRWCTYNTPMDGTREASAHSIVFQSRHGTPELNCCSVNGPRGWGMLSEWAFMKSRDGYVINWLAPSSATFSDSITNLIDSTAAPRTTPITSTPVLVATGQDPFGRGYTVENRNRTFWVAGDYPRTGRVEIRPQLNHEEEFTLHIRIPEWSTNTRAWLNDEELPAPLPGKFLSIRRTWSSHWKKDDIIRLSFDLTPRIVPGAREAAGKISILRGPILLAADQRFNSFDQSPALDPAKLQDLQLESSFSPTNNNDLLSRVLDPLLVVRTVSATGEPIRLCDFATAGATGTRYQSWLPATNAPPPPVVTRIPRDSATLPTGNILFRWTQLQNPQTNIAQFLQLFRTADFRGEPLLQIPVSSRAALVPISADLIRTGQTTQTAQSLDPDNPWCYWRIVTSNRFGLTPGTPPYARFRIDPNLPPVNESLPHTGSGILVSHTEPLAFNGTGKRVFDLNERAPDNNQPTEWPEENYSVSFRFRLRVFPTNRIGQLFSAWAAPMDDPLRLTIDQGRLSARIEAGAAYSTPAVPVELGKWHRVTATKHGATLTLTLDGQDRGTCTVPAYITTRANDFALGGNPHFNGNEFVHAEIEKFEFHGN
jgi:DUF1680 family protein